MSAKRENELRRSEKNCAPAARLRASRRNEREARIRIAPLRKKLRACGAFAGRRPRSQQIT